MRESIRALGVPLALVLLVATSADAQTARRRQRSPTTASVAVRAELAAVLLQSGKYSDAAREYRTLLDRDPWNRGYRLSLAKSLAWGGDYGEAERELSVLRSMRANDAEVEQLERLVRPNLEPSSTEARGWVAQNPSFQPYRVALAKAYMRERQYRAAIEVYDALLSTNPSPVLVRELADAYSAANDRRAGIGRLRSYVARSPADTGYRLALIDLLVADRQFPAAVAQSDTLLSYGRTPGALLSRARLDIARDDLGAAERDLNEALALRQTPQAYLLLGDTYRWRGEFGRARAAYNNARIMRGGKAVTEAFAQLTRDERSVLTFEPPSIAGAGWQTGATFDSDNGGIHYSTMDFRRGFDVGAGFTGSAGLEVRQLREASPTVSGAAGSYAARLGLSREGVSGPFYGRVGASAGPVFQPLAQTVAAGSLALTGRYYAWSASMDLAAGPAYPLLRTLTSIMPLGEGSRPITAMSAAFALAGPIGVANVAVGLARASLSDDNQRTEKQAYARLPLTPAVSVIYWGTGISFARPSAMYWAPTSYSSNAVGLEVAARQLRGWSLMLRALPGFASTTETPFIRSATVDTGARKLRFQISTGGELAYRRPTWETGIGFNWGRVAGYTRTSLSARVTLSR